MVSSSIGAVDAATLTTYSVDSPAVDSAAFNSTTDSTGAYTLNVFDGKTNYVEVRKDGIATYNSAFFSLNIDVANVNFSMVPESEANVFVGQAFGGMMLTLPDKAWLAIDVRDSNGNEVDAVTVTSSPAQDGGGALACDGTYTGTNTTAANPPCNPLRTGPMYLAYFDADKEVAVSADNTGAVVHAPVRMGEITVVELSGSAAPPNGGGGSTPTGTLSLSVEDGGSVSSSPDVISCSGAGTGGSRLCTAQVRLGQVVVLTATPDAGNHFDDWDGCWNPTETPAGGTCTLTIELTQHIRAEFDPN